MTRSRPLFVLLLAVCLLVGLPYALEAQAAPLRPVTVGSPMPDFTLPAYQGGEVTLSDLLGKTVVLIFPRGRSGPGSWCHVCNYQHMELVAYEATYALRQRANLEILFVLPDYYADRPKPCRRPRTRAAGLCLVPGSRIP